MKFISWNVNGLRACIQKGFLDFFSQANADFFCLQETKLQEGQIALELPGYEQYWCYAEKKGYSGTAIFTKHTPMSVRYGLGIPELDTEGRLITLEYPEFYLVTCYTPNAQRELARIEHRMKWEDAFRAYLKALDEVKPVILCGDLNVAHQEIDLKNPASNRGSAGFSDQERSAFTRLLESGFTDTFRHLNPDAAGCYTWWSYMFSARKNNAGWRIDYFVVSDRLKDVIYDAPIHSDILGSDHCPVELELGISCNGSIWKSDAEGTPSQRKQFGLPISDKAKKAVISGTACLLLALGFAAGFFTNRLFQKSQANDLPITDPLLSESLQLNNVISNPLFTDPVGTLLPDENLIQQINAAQAKSMTTWELIILTTQIPELIQYTKFSPSTIYSSVINPIRLDSEDYDGLKQKYPVLAELETREDAARLIRLIVMTYSVKDYKTDVLSLLMTLDVFRQNSDFTYGYNSTTDLDNDIVVITPAYTEPVEG